MQNPVADLPLKGDVPLKEVRALRHRLIDANDDKVSRIIALLDKSGHAAVNEALLTPLRARLAMMRPQRPLRFNRLLFIPFDGQIVNARQWRPGQPSLPRSALTVIAGTIRAQLGALAGQVDAMVAGAFTDMADIVAAAGGALWPAAAAVLDGSAAPPGWDQTGLAADVWSAMAQTMAGVLRRASLLLTLARDFELGALETDEELLGQILKGIEHEASPTRDMIIGVILHRAPSALPMVLPLINRSCEGSSRAECNASVQRAMDVAIEQIDLRARHLGSSAGTELLPAASEARRLIALLMEVERHPASARHRARLAGFRPVIEQACATRFAGSLHDDLIAPLKAASQNLDVPEQSRLESVARGLRTFASVVRGLQTGASYEPLLQDAAQAVRETQQSGALTLVRRLRLIEILAGPDAAEAEYQASKARA